MRLPAELCPDFLLQRARELLLQTDLSLVEYIALAGVKGMAAMLSSLKLTDATDRPPSSIGRRGFSAALLACAGMRLVPSIAAADDVASGTVVIEQVQIAFIGSGNLGGGTLFVGGNRYPFTIGGLGIGGIGISRMEATGTVYDLRALSDFPGAYVQARYGLAVGQLSAGELWLQNTRGVGLHLQAKRQGLALSLGGDAVFIDFD